VGVEVEGHSDGGVTEALLNDSGVHSQPT
jgi:hypothetical protein